MKFLLGLFPALFLQALPRGAATLPQRRNGQMQATRNILKSGCP